jgi:hypothetical protein
MRKKFSYHNKEIRHISGGGKLVRKVTIKNGKGFKSVTKYRGGKKVGTSRKPIHNDHIELIAIGKFIPGLFSDCKCGQKTRKRH